MSTHEETPEGIHYLLGHSDHELRRLDVQGELFRPVTRRAFLDAGIRPGMRVLDLGCGSGDVSMLASEIVGTSGSVVGIDRGEAAVGAARARAAERGLLNVDFRVSEIDDFDEPEAFDALVGRFILMHQTDPAAVLAQAARAVRSGGIVCMVESYMQGIMTGAHSLPHSPLYDEIVAWKGQVVGGAGADTDSGARMHATFHGAGLPAPTTRLESTLEGGPDSGYYEYLALSLESMQPEAERQGLTGGLAEADPAEVGLRLREEVVESGGVLVVWPVVAGWCRKP